MAGSEEIRALLWGKVKHLGKLKKQMKELQSSFDSSKKEAGGLLDKLGEPSFKVDGIGSIHHIHQSKSSVDKGVLVAEMRKRGLSLKQAQNVIEASTSRWDVDYYQFR